MLNPICSNKLLPHDHWIDFFDLFSGDCYQQHISIKNISLEFGDKSLINYSPLIAISYVQDPKGDWAKPTLGERLIITVNQSDLLYTHTIYSPTEVSIKQRSNGEIMAVWIRDAAGTKTSIRLKSSDLSFYPPINHRVMQIAA